MDDCNLGGGTNDTNASPNLLIFGSILYGIFSFWLISRILNAALKEF